MTQKQENILRMLIGTVLDAETYKNCQIQIIALKLLNSRKYIQIYRPIKKGIKLIEKDDIFNKVDLSNKDIFWEKINSTPLLLDLHFQKQIRLIAIIAWYIHKKDDFDFFPKNYFH